MKVGPLTDEQIAKFMGTIESMLRNPTVQLSWSCGVRYWNNYDTGYREAEPTEGRTITIEVHDGATEIQESAEDELRRLIRKTE
jgi:hypothetical protein